MRLKVRTKSAVLFLDSKNHKCEYCNSELDENNCFVIIESNEKSLLIQLFCSVDCYMGGG